MESISEVLVRTEQTLETAKHGFDDLVSKNKVRRFTGLRNLIVFGRSVTFVLQNLKSVIGKDRFDSWYEPHQESMKQDVVMKYFVKLRNELEKQGRLPVSSSARIHNFSSDMISKYKQPPGTVGFFIGDQLGGSGFEVELPDGTKEKYYVEIPSSVAEVTQHFNELPVPDDNELKAQTIEQLSEYFLNTLEALLDNARKEFLEQETQTVNGRRLPPFIRVVK
ncbi:hypothetical protein NH514_16325 [Pseudoalteromonas sp. ACER1]|uniref:hypothetical protein n=1 Tax=unclassified Pseudoalteromonas TaxID=194690 RepID=UPI001F29E59F|nr:MULTISPECIES: hypothetical protein [unclassified Pseudoalteromonas]MCF2848867.1 hypothetical protein [Pseudoalteromonas sp. PAST1]MCO7212287.1 hypothetical protein [Pseudoalteromonas sp. ACER1]